MNRKLVLGVSTLLVGCTATQRPGGKSDGQAAAEPAAAIVRQGPTGQVDLSRNKPAIDSEKVKSGQGTSVKGMNDWEGEITGLPAANSKFTKLVIGMPMQQVIDLIGQPTDQGSYVTGKALHSVLLRQRPSALEEGVSGARAG